MSGIVHLFNGLKGARVCLVSVRVTGLMEIACHLTWGSVVSVAWGQLNGGLFAWVIFALSPGHTGPSCDLLSGTPKKKGRAVTIFYAALSYCTNYTAYPFESILFLWIDPQAFINKLVEVTLPHIRGNFTTIFRGNSWPLGHNLEKKKKYQLHHPNSLCKHIALQCMTNI